MRVVGIILVAAWLLAAPAAAAAAPAGEDFPVPGSLTELESLIRSRISDIDGRVGVYVSHMETGVKVGIAATERFQLASVFKIPVLLALHRQIALGKLSLDDRIVLAEKMKTFGSGLLPAMKPGLNLSIQDLALLMMARSDNTATDILFDVVGPETIAAYMAELGLRDTTIDYDTRALILAYQGLDPENRLTIAERRQLPKSVWDDPARLERQKAFGQSLHNTSTPAEIGLLLEKCVKGEIVDRAASDRIIETMKHHTGAEIILRYLPYGTPVARKGGSLSRGGAGDSVLLDAAILWLPEGRGTLVMCLFGNDLDEVHYEVKDKLGRIARAAYDYFVSGRPKT